MTLPYGHEDPHRDEYATEDGRVLGGRLNLVEAAHVQASRVRHLWEGRIPLGASTLLPGEEVAGKSTLLGLVTSQVTRGTLPGDRQGQPGHVIVVAPEDHIAQVAVPRLRQAGAELTKITFVPSVRGAEPDTERSLTIPRDLPELADLAEERGSVMVWIDSLVTTMPDGTKSISYQDTAKVLTRLGSFAEATGVAVVAPWHLNKASGGDTALRMMDSRAFRTAVRSVLLVAADPDQPDHIVVALDKSNGSTLNVPALRFRIQASHYTHREWDESAGRTVETPASCSIAVPLGEVEGDGRAAARALLAPTVERSTSVAWLRDQLAQGEAARADVLQAAKAAGISESSVKRAARTLGIVSEERGSRSAEGVPRRAAIWSLPQVGSLPADTRPTGPTGPNGESSYDRTDTTSAGQPELGQSGQLVPCRVDDATEDDPEFTAAAQLIERELHAVPLPLSEEVAS